MRAWFWTIFLIVLAVALAVLVQTYPGNVLVVVGEWRVQVSLAFGLMLVIVAFAVIYFLLKIIGWLVDAPGRYRDWRAGRREKTEQSQLEQGWAALLEGHYELAEKLLSRLAGNSRDLRRKVLSQLSSARAAHEMGEYKKRDEMLGLAKQGASTMTHDKSMGVAVAVASADLWLEEGQADKALETLMAWKQESQKHVHMMRLLLKAYQLLGNHEKVIETTRMLMRKHALSNDQARSILEKHVALLLRDTKDHAQWLQIWKSLKSEERLYPEIALAGASGFSEQGDHREASKILELAIQDSFDARLLAAYSQAPEDQIVARLQKAEKWLSQRPDDVDLLMTVGALCLIGQMWGQAQRYLEKASRLRSDAKVHALLGSLYDRLGKPSMAMNHWRKATAFTAALPVLADETHLPAADLASDPKIHHVEGLGAVDDDLLEQMSVPTGDSIASAHPIFPSSHVPEPSKDKSGGESSAVNDYEDYFDSAPIPYDGAPILKPQPASGDEKTK